MTIKNLALLAATVIAAASAGMGNAYAASANAGYRPGGARSKVN